MPELCGNVSYQPMSLAQHDAQAVARLIFESAPELLILMFGWRPIATLTQLVQRSHNRFSHQYVRVTTIDQQVVGIATLLPVTALHYASDYDEILNGVQKLWLKLVRFLVLRHVSQQYYPVGAFYLGNVAVAAAYRNQGMAMDKAR